MSCRRYPSGCPVRCDLGDQGEVLQVLEIFEAFHGGGFFFERAKESVVMRAREGEVAGWKTWPQVLIAPLVFEAYIEFVWLVWLVPFMRYHAVILRLC